MNWNGYRVGDAVQIRVSNEWPAGTVTEVWSNGVRVNPTGTSFGIAVSEPSMIRRQGEPGTVSHGTLRTQDLVRKFEREIFYLDPAGYDRMIDMFCAPQNGAHQDPNADYWQSELAANYLELLTTILDAMAPADHYFGAHPGDGSDFGFWEVES